MNILLCNKTCLQQRGSAWPFSAGVDRRSPLLSGYSGALLGGGSKVTPVATGGSASTVLREGARRYSDWRDVMTAALGPFRDYAVTSVHQEWLDG